MEIPYGALVRLPVFGVNVLYGRGGSDADVFSFANGAFVAVFNRVDLNGFHGFFAIAAVKDDIAPFRVEVLPLLSEGRDVDEIVVRHEWRKELRVSGAEYTGRRRGAKEKSEKIRRKSGDSFGSGPNVPKT
jgi:hypothetical protein